MQQPRRLEPYSCAHSCAISLGFSARFGDTDPCELACRIARRWTDDGCAQPVLVLHCRIAPSEPFNRPTEFAIRERSGANFQHRHCRTRHRILQTWLRSRRSESRALRGRGTLQRTHRHDHVHARRSGKTRCDQHSSRFIGGRPIRRAQSQLELPTWRGGSLNLGGYQKPQRPRCGRNLRPRRIGRAQIGTRGLARGWHRLHPDLQCRIRRTGDRRARWCDCQFTRTHGLR